MIAPMLHNKDKAMFLSYLEKSQIYFEFGSGGSTLAASDQQSIERIYSVDSDKQWLEKLEKQLNY